MIAGCAYVLVTVQDTVRTPQEGISARVFDGVTYQNMNGVTDTSSQVEFILLEGDYHFQADYDGVKSWLEEVNHCTLPGCAEAVVEIPGGFGTTEVTIDYAYDSLDRLTFADYADGAYFHYGHDDVDNRPNRETLTGANTYAYDIINRLTVVVGVTYAWDANGNLPPE